MSDTQALLGKIAALRQRLEQARGLAEDAGSAAAALLEYGSDRPDPMTLLQQKVAAGFREGESLSGSLRQLPGATRPPGEDEPLPSHLTARARRILPRVRDLLGRLRELAEHPLLSRLDDDPLPGLHRRATLLAEVAVRALQTLPETPSLQLRLCEGVEGILADATRHTGALTALLDGRGREEGQIDRLSALLTALASGQATGLKPALELAEAVLEEAAQARPLRSLYAPPADLARFVACHGLTVARVAARLLKHSPEWRARPEQVVTAALLHDVGMMRVPVEILAQTQPLDEAQRRTLEGHPAAGAELLARPAADAPWLAEAAASHHERLDGTGYPAGLSDLQISPLVRLLSVCDLYAALCCPRPHRPALETRTALTDTLLLAQQGGLDSEHAKLLLELSLYPVGTAVELADGAVGVVVATHQGRKDPGAIARPVVALLTDGQGQPLPYPDVLDLGEAEGRSIVRSLPAAERRRLLGGPYPEWARLEAA
jgi:hypothetical protein